MDKKISITSHPESVVLVYSVDGLPFQKIQIPRVIWTQLIVIDQEVYCKRQDPGCDTLYAGDYVVYKGYTVSLSEQPWTDSHRRPSKDTFYRYLTKLTAEMVDRHQKRLQKQEARKKHPQLETSTYAGERHRESTGNRNPPSMG